METSLPLPGILLAIFLVSLGVQILVIFLSHKHDLFIDSHTDEKPQRFHDTPTSRAGGIGIFIGLLALLVTPIGWKLAMPMFLAFLSGIGEDINYMISPKIRLFLQMVAALTSIFLLDSVVTYIGLGVTLPYSIAIVFSTFAIVGVMNAINIIDGFNGLASGIVLLILTAFGSVAYQVGDADLAVIDLFVMAAVLGFFILNFPKGKIFMGDGGAYMLGFIVAVSGIFLASNHEDVSPWFIFSVLIYPVWEVLFSMFRKLRTGNSPLHPDRFHFHMLINRHITKSNPDTAFFIIVLNAPFVLLPILYANNSMANMLTSAIFIAIYLALYFRLLQKEPKTESL